MGYHLGLCSCLTGSALPPCPPLNIDSRNAMPPYRTVPSLYGWRSESSLGRACIHQLFWRWLCRRRRPGLRLRVSSAAPLELVTFSVPFAGCSNENVSVARFLFGVPMSKYSGVLGPCDQHGLAVQYRGVTVRGVTVRAVTVRTHGEGRQTIRQFRGPFLDTFGTRPCPRIEAGRPLLQRSGSTPGQQYSTVAVLYGALL